MVESGDWVVPHYEGQALLRQADPRLLADGRRDERPRAGRRRRAARRRWSASIGVVLATVWLGTLLFDRRSALAGGAGAGHDPRVPVLRAGGDVGHAARAVDDAGRRPRRPRLPARGAGAGRCRCSARWLGLGFATKGPIALLVPGLAVLLLLWENRRAAAPVRVAARSPSASSPSPCSGSAGSRSSTGGSGAEPLVSFFFRENLERFAGEAYDVGRPFWFYPPAYLAEGLPWSPFLPIALWRLLRSREGDEAQRARFLAVWVGARARAPEPLARARSTTTCCRSTRRLSLRDRPLPRRACRGSGPTARGPASSCCSRRRRSPSSSPCPPRIPDGVAARARCRGCSWWPWSRRARPCCSPWRCARRRAARAAALASRGRRGVARARRLLPAGLRRRPAQPRDRGRRGARAVVPARPADGLLLRPDRA